MNEAKAAAQKTIEKAALTIGQDGDKDFVFALSQISSDTNHAFTGFAIAGKTDEIIKGLVATMHQDADFKKIMLASVNRYLLNKLFNRRIEQCDCPDCLIERAIK